MGPVILKSIRINKSPIENLVWAFQNRKAFIRWKLIRWQPYPRRRKKNKKFKSDLDEVNYLNDLWQNFFPADFVPFFFKRAPVNQFDGMKKWIGVTRSHLPIHFLVSFFSSFFLKTFSPTSILFFFRDVRLVTVLIDNYYFENGSENRRNVWTPKTRLKLIFEVYYDEIIAHPTF